MSESEYLDPGKDVHGMAPEELRQLGEDSFRNRLIDQAMVAHQRHGPLAAATVDAFLKDSQCIRYPTRVLYEFGEMAGHQFGQPEIDFENPEGRILYLHPLLEKRGDLASLAVAYLAPAINYGEVVSDEHCLAYGATVQGMTIDEFYQAICGVADAVGSEPRYLEGGSAGGSGRDPGGPG